MSLSLICTCGARLEIDDKFAGQTILCPDCHKQLETRPPPPKPARTSGWALASLMLALIGAFTVIGPVLAMLCGWVSLRQQERFPAKVGGKNYAWSGIILGGCFFVLSLGALWSAEVFGIDGLMREIEWASKVDYPPDLVVKGNDFSVTRANESWGILKHVGREISEEAQSDDRILVRPRVDAQVGCMTIEVHEREEPDVHLERALQRFLNSELVALLGNFQGKAPKLTPEARDKKKIEGPKGAMIQEMTVDLKLGGYPRTFLFRVIKVDHLFKINVIVGGTRRQRFARLEPELRKMLESYQAGQ